MNLKHNKDFYFIYKTTNLINGKIYVGQRSSNSLDDGYLGSGSIITKSIKKNGVENFRREVLEFCTSSEELNEREIFWIKTLNARDKNIGYNIMEGGLRNSLPGEMNPMFGRKGLDNPNTGRKNTQETLLKMSRSRVNRIISQETKDKISKSNTGRLLSTETRDKISKANKGKKKPKSQGEKLSIFRKNFKYTEEQKLNISKGQLNRAPVTCPHCSKQGSGTIMKRWHFDNCYLVSMENRIKQSNKYKNRIVSEETKIKNSKSHLEKIIVTCSYCGLVGKYNSAMKRWHFDNCKKNPNKQTKP